MLQGSNSLPAIIPTATLFVTLIGWSCMPNEIVEPRQESAQPFVINASAYARNYFFLDTSYIAGYSPFVQSDPPIVTRPELRVVEIEVWRTARSTLNELSQSKTGIADIHLGPRMPAYHDSLRSRRGEIPGSRMIGRFIRIDPRMVDLINGGYTGVVAIREPLDDSLAIAVCFRRQDGHQFGEFAASRPPDSTAILLKLVRPHDLYRVGPAYPVAWSLGLKNVYNIGVRDVSRQEFVLDVYYTPSGAGKTNAILGTRLLSVLSLDRYSSTGAPVADGLFDFLPERTVVVEHGDIILPSLRPFDDGLRHYFGLRGVSIPHNFLAPELYDSAQSAIPAEVRSLYTIAGRARERQ